MNDDEDKEDDGEEEDLLAAHEANRAAAQASHEAAAASYKASTGSDSASLLMAAEDAGDAAAASHEAAKATSRALRGAAAVQEAQPNPPPAGARAPVAPLVRSIATSGGASLGAQLDVAQSVAFAARMKVLFGGTTLDETEGLARAAHQDARDAVALRVAAKKEADAAVVRAKKDADAALRAELAAAVRAGKYTRAELFAVSESVDSDGKPIEVLTPLTWVRDLTPAARASMIASKQARVGVGGVPAVEPDESPVHISAAVRAYAKRRGITDEKKIAALAAQLGATPMQEAP